MTTSTSQVHNSPEATDGMVPVGVSPSPATSEPVVKVRGLVKRFRRADGSVVPAVDEVDLDVHPGEFVVLLGPSGCGKTTLLRCVAGLEQPTAGTIELHGRSVFSSAAGLNVPPERRRISMIFQSYALWPHMSAFENIAYPLRARKVPKDQIAERVARALDMVGIPELTKQYPGQMSGGQQQRVALARAIVAEDELILFDEPLSNVDAKVREQLRLELLSMQRELGFSALYVTHDQAEAMELGHQIAVMRTGKVAQIGSPRVVYERPVSRYVANFVGTINELHGTITTAAEGSLDEISVQTELGEIVATSGNADLEAGNAVVVVMRPECCTLSVEEPTGANRWRGAVKAALFLGSHTEHVIEIGTCTFRVWRPDTVLLDVGAAVWVSIDSSGLWAVRASDVPVGPRESAE